MQKKIVKFWFALSRVQDPVQILPLKWCFKSNKNRVNNVEGEKAKDSLQHFTVPKQKNEHKMEACSKHLMNWKTVQKSFDPIKKSIKGTHTEDQRRQAKLILLI